MKIFPLCNTQIRIVFSSETIDLGKNKQHQYLNALKIPKNIVIGSVATRIKHVSQPN